LQASHEFQFLAAPVSAIFSYLTERVRHFFKAGAPTEHTQTWDLTPRL
jgi:hypothetical protein